MLFGEKASAFGTNASSRASSATRSPGQGNKRSRKALAAREDTAYFWLQAAYLFIRIPSSQAAPASLAPPAAQNRELSAEPPQATRQGHNAITGQHFFIRSEPPTAK